MAEVDVITAEVAQQPAARMRGMDMKAVLYTQVGRDRAQLMHRHHTPALRMAHRTRQHTAVVVVRLIAVPLTVAAHLMAAVGSTKNPSDQIGRRRNIKTAESRRRYVSTQI